MSSNIRASTNGWTCKGSLTPSGMEPEPCYAGNAIASTVCRNCRKRRDRGDIALRNSNEDVGTFRDCYNVNYYYAEDDIDRLAADAARLANGTNGTNGTNGHR